jgi:hypothetical protein
LLCFDGYKGEIKNGSTKIIDVSKLTHLQAAIALLVERHGEDGVRVCELCKEINAAPRAVKRVLAFLLQFKFIKKKHGEIPKYVVTVESPKNDQYIPHNSNISSFLKF